MFRDIKTLCRVSVILIFIAACTNRNNIPYKGYSKSTKGLYYHRYNIGDGKNYPEEGDSLFVLLKYLPTNQLLLKDSCSNTFLDTFLFQNPKDASQLYEALSMLSEGDSCSFIGDSSLLTNNKTPIACSYQLKADPLVKMEIKLIRLKTLQQQEIESSSRKKILEELAADEKKSLDIFLDTTKQLFSKTPEENGLYFLLKHKGTGKKVKNGDRISIRYTGKFLNGEVFDNATQNGNHLDFTLGEKGQVLRGIELALYKMHEGDVAWLILPSSLAFGNKGSAAGIVSPFKTLTFELEILKIN